MSRSSWNIHDTDVVGVEFMGVGYTGHAVTSHENWRALRFRAQRTGEVDEVGIYSGRNTTNPVLTAAHFFGKRAPFIIELIPVSGFDPGGPHTITTYGSTVTSASGVVDQGGSTSFSNELTAANDDLFLISTGSTVAVAVVQMAGASAFPTDQHVLSIAIEHSFLRQMRVQRVDHNTGLVGWQRVLPAGVNKWHMGEAYLEQGDPTNWRLWTPTTVRQFASAVGNRRLRVQALSRTQSQIIDLLRMHVDHIPERRAGVGIFESDARDAWVTVPFHAPASTSTPAHVTEGTEYVLLIRTPGGPTDYTTLAVLDTRTVSDRKVFSSFQHFTDLDWDFNRVSTWSEFAPRALTGIVDGLAAVRLINDGAQTVDSQPYERTVGARVFSGQTAVQEDLGITDPAAEYSAVRFIASRALSPTEVLQVTVTGSGGGTGPHQVTSDEVEVSPIVGVDELGHTYHEVRLEFGSGITLPNPVDVVFTSDTVATNPWLISGLASRTTPGTGDQTFVSSSGTSQAVGVALDPTSTIVTGFDTYGRVDLEVALFSQAPEVTGVGVTTQFQPVTGGPCEPCGPHEPLGCKVLAIPYSQLCWSPSTLPLSEFSHYEIQRTEGGGDWITAAAVTVTGAPEEPVRGTGFYSLAQSTSHVAPSVTAFTNHDLLICAWQSFDFINNYTVPGSMTAGPETDGATFCTMRSAYQTLAAAGSTGTRTATFGASDKYSSASAVVRGAGSTAPVVQQTLSGVGSGNVTLVTAAGTQEGWWLVAVQGWDESDAAEMPQPSQGPGGQDWIAVADSEFCCQLPGADSTSRTRIWARRVTATGAQSVTFYDGAVVADNHAHLFVLSNVDTLTAAANVPRCWDDWSAPFDTEICYRIRQTRVDGITSDWSPTVCTTVAAPGGADVVITAPDAPELNAAFPESHGSRLPVEQEWEVLDSDDVTFRQVYGRDNQLAFRPLERKGLTFSRRLLVSALCTATTPCLDVVRGMRDLTNAQVPYLVVRNACGDRWYANVQLSTVIRQQVPELRNGEGTIWFVDIRVTELVTPVIEVPTVDE